MRLAMLAFAALVSASVGAAEGYRDAMGQALLAALEEGVPLGIAHGLVMAESGGNPRAVSKRTEAGYVSEGIVQLYTEPRNLAYLVSEFWTGRGETEPFDIWNPEHNARVGFRYLLSLRERYGNWFDALCHYNHGSLYGVSEETVAYARAIIGGEK